MPWLGQRLDERARHLARVLGARCGRAAGPGAAARPWRVRSRLHPLTRHPQEPARPHHAGGSSSAPIAAGPRRSHRKNSTLPDGPGQRADRHRPRAPAARGGRVGDRARPPRRAAPGRAPPRPCRPAPCRPRTAASPSAPGRRRRAVTPSSGVEHQREGDERQVADDQVDRPADQLRGQLADVGAVVHHAPGRRCAATRPAGRSRRRRPPPRAPRAAAARR